MSRKFSNENNPARKLMKFPMKHQQRALSATNKQRKSFQAFPIPQSPLEASSQPYHTFKIFNRNKASSLNKHNIHLSQATKMITPKH